VGFAPNQRHVLRVYGYDRTLIAELDGRTTLSVETSEPLAAGELGFLTHGNDQARFYTATVVELV
jgi:hypothetical protein